MNIASFWRTNFQAFGIALAFMTRLGRAHIVDDISLGRALVFYTPVGLVLGLLSTAPFYIYHLLGLASPLTATAFTPWIAGFAYVLMDMWLTRALHYDGLADMGDALGSGAQGEKFWHILKDSRLGAFGALALFMGIIAMLMGVAQHIEQRQLWPLLLAPIYARALCTVFICCSKPHNPDSLGGKAIAGKSPTLGLCNLALLLLLCVPFGFTKAAITLILTSLIFYKLWNTARQQQGANGDFFGAIIVCGQGIYLLCI